MCKVIDSNSCITLFLINVARKVTNRNERYLSTSLYAVLKLKHNIIIIIIIFIFIIVSSFLLIIWVKIPAFTHHVSRLFHEFTQIKNLFHTFTQKIYGFHVSRIHVISRNNAKINTFSRNHAEKKGQSRNHATLWGASVSVVLCSLLLVIGVQLKAAYL